MRLLLVEDDTLLGEGIKTALTHLKYNVHWLTQGKDVISTLRSNMSYSLLILDLGLPDTDGIAILKSLRNKEINLPVLILTARANLEDKILGLD